LPYGYGEKEKMKKGKNHTLKKKEGKKDAAAVFPPGQFIRRVW
jgi:hypothetical protein